MPLSHKWKIKSRCGFWILLTPRAFCNGFDSHWWADTKLLANFLALREHEMILSLSTHHLPFKRFLNGSFTFNANTTIRFKKNYSYPLLFIISLKASIVGSSEHVSFSDQSASKHVLFLIICWKRYRWTTPLLGIIGNCPLLVFVLFQRNYKR